MSNSKQKEQKTLNKNCSKAIEDIFEELTKVTYQCESYDSGENQFTWEDLQEFHRTLSLLKSINKK